MEENLRQYELNYFLSPYLSEEEVSTFFNKIKNFLNEIQGKTEEFREPKIQKLAFSLKGHSEGYFGEIKFLAEPEKIPELEKKLKLETNILRFSILTVLPKKQRPEKPMKKPRIRPAEPNTIEEKEEKKTEAKEKEAKPETKKEKVKLEEIDKKLDEIIGNI